MDNLKEFLPYLRPQQRLDLKAVALTHILELTGSAEGISMIIQLKELIASLFELTLDQNYTIAKDATLCLINLTAECEKAAAIYEISTTLTPGFPIVENAVRCITDEESGLADPWSMVLSNLTRVENLVPDILTKIDDDAWLGLVKAFTKLDYNKKGAKLHYLASIFCNVTQTSKGRQIICQSKQDILSKILPFAHYEASLVRRGGTIGILKNICFDAVFHDIITEKENFLTAILYPLTGPEEFSDEENDKFPIELQYLPETKTREEDPDLRKMLLESLLQLCATKQYRELLRSKGVYEILREYHKWEAKVGKDKECILACENVVDILIRKEEEIGLNNLKEVEVPQNIAEDFVKQDINYIENIL